MKLLFRGFFVLAQMTFQRSETDPLAIDCENLVYSFNPGENAESVLDGIDLKLARGDRCLLIGANGGQSVGYRL